MNVDQFRKQAQVWAYIGIFLGPVLGALCTYVGYLKATNHGQVHNAIFYLFSFSAVAFPCFIGGLFLLYCLRKPQK